MNNLIQNYKIILEELTKTCSHIKSTKSIRIPQTFRFGIGCTKYHRRIHVYKLRITSFKCIFQTELEEKIKRSVYNKRRRNLFPYTEKIRKILSSKFSDFTDVFIIGLKPTFHNYQDSFPYT